MNMDRVMTTRELANYMKLNEKTILKMAHNREIPGIKIGNQWRFHMATIDKYLQEDIIRTPNDELDVIINTSQTVVPLSRLMDPDLMKLDLKAITKDGLLFELAEIACKAGLTSAKKKLFNQLLKREKMLSTAVGNGIAIPHPRNPNPALFKKPNIVMARSKKGVDFHAPDDKKVHLFFMTCAPNMIVHLRLMAKISKMLHIEGVIDKFMNAVRNDEIIQLLLEMERKHLFPWG